MALKKYFFQDSQISSLLVVLVVIFVVKLKLKLEALTLGTLRYLATLEMLGGDQI